VDGHLRHPTARLLVALALAAVATGALGAPGPGAQETPDEPPEELEPTAAPAHPQPDGGVSREPREPSPGDAPPAGPGNGQAPAEREPGERGGQRSWIDASHGFLGEKLLYPVMRIDRFFSDETELEAERARSFIRWRNEVRFEYDVGEPSFATNLRASLRFPGVTRALRRLRLVIEGETQDAGVPELARPGDVEADPAEGRVRTGDAELRLRVWDGLLAHADLGAGVLFEMPPGAFGRARLRWAFPVGRLFLTRVALIGFYRTDERFGAETELQLERPITSRVLARLSSKMRVSEESPGVEWQSEAVTFVTLGSRAVGAIGAGVNGATGRVPGPVEAYRVFTRLRRDFYRSWLFFELTPEYSWPYTPGNGREPTWAVTTRLEVQFQGRRRPPDPEEPEPEDPPPPDDAGAR
jgi:hypothetical protein